MLRQLGRNVTLWRTISSLSASELAERAAITRATLRGIEHGTGTASSDALMATLIALGVADDVVAASSPMASEVGRARLEASAGMDASRGS